MTVDRYFYFIYDDESFYEKTNLVDILTFIFVDIHPKYIFENTYSAFTLAVF